MNMKYLKGINESTLGEALKRRADARYKIIEKTKEVLESFDTNFVDMHEMKGFTYNFMFSKNFNYETRLRKYNSIEDIDISQIDVHTTSLILFIDSNIDSPSLKDIENTTEFNMMPIKDFDNDINSMQHFINTYNYTKEMIVENISRLEQFDIKLINPKFHEEPVKIANINSKIKFIICIELFEQSAY